MQTKILAVEDDEAWSRLIRKILEKRGYRVDVADNADAAFEKIGEELPDVILLDVSLKGISGFKLCEMLRADSATASVRIIMLTAMKEVGDKIRGLQLGADDYLPKPFDGDELAARIEAVLRRNSSLEPAANKLKSKHIEVDLDRHEVFFKGKLVELRPKEFELLVLFIKNKGRVLKRDFLAESIWGKDLFASSQTIAQHIKNLRAKLGLMADSIETIETVGYKYNEPR